MIGEAQYLHDSELLKEIFDGMERDAIERCVHTDDDETRRVSAMEVRTIRSVRQKLKSLCSDKTNLRTGAVV
jgi:hypothetical protein